MDDPPSSKLHYKVYGESEHILIFFHGFGQNQNIVEDLLPTLSEKFNVVSVDLPNHGVSPNYTHRLDSNFFVDLALEIKHKTNASKVSLMGYSLGARFGLLFWQHCPYPITHFFGIAPDGISSNPLFALATRSVVGKRLFSFFKNRPNLLLSTSEVLKKLHLIDIKAQNLAAFQFSNPKYAQRVYRTWINVSAKIDFELLRQKQAADFTRVTLLYGKYDTIIKPIDKSKLKNKLQAKIVIVDRGHNLINRKLNNELESLEPFLF